MRRLMLWLRGTTGLTDRHPYSAEWDAFLSSAIDAGGVKIRSEYRAVIGGVEVWTANYPYAFGRPAFGLEVLPSLKTRARLHEACIRAVIQSAAGAA